MSSTIDCNDAPPAEPSDATIRVEAARMERQYPVFGQYFGGYLTACQQWPTRRELPPAPVIDHAANILIIGGTHDPAEPYRGAQRLSAALGNHAELLTWTGQGHTIYLRGNTCVDSNVTRYLITGQMPPHNTTCRP